MKFYSINLNVENKKCVVKFLTKNFELNQKFFFAIFTGGKIK